MQNKIVQLGDPVLRQIARELSIDEIKSQEIQNLIQMMREVMRGAPGVGLAAPQIGVSLQIAVIEDKENYFQEMLPNIRKERGREEIKFHVIINPKLTIIDATPALFFEACLSVHGCGRITPRAQRVRVECLDEKGNKQVINASGWYARILQHEIDHLNGKLYIDITNAESEIMYTDENKKRWLNASAAEIKAHLAKLT